jgi:hypothetical protein
LLDVISTSEEASSSSPWLLHLEGLGGGLDEGEPASLVFRLAWVLGLESVLLAMTVLLLY